MPWRPTPERIPAHQRALKFWYHHHIPVRCADSGPGPFHRARARNNAVRAVGSEWVIIADADCLVDIAAVEQGFRYPTVVSWPHNEFRYIDPAWVDRSDLMNAPITLGPYRNAHGGMWMCRRELYWELGGMDESFEPVWGYEDAAFYAVAKTLRQVRHLPGVLFSFDHGGTRDETPANPNYARWLEYARATGRREAMRQLLRR